MRDEFQARHWLWRFKDDPRRRAALRKLLSKETVTSGLHLATDNDVIDSSIQLLISGVWRLRTGVEEPSTSRGGGGGTDQVGAAARVKAGSSSPDQTSRQGKPSGRLGSA
jgi:hypothetical protein